MSMADDVIAHYEGSDHEEETESADERGAEKELGSMVRKAMKSGDDDALYEAICAIVRHEQG